MIWTNYSAGNYFNIHYNLLFTNLTVIHYKNIKLPYISKKLQNHSIVQKSYKTKKIFIYKITIYVAKYYATYIRTKITIFII